MLSAIMVYGATGNGKSSLIKLFCGNNIKKEIVSHKAKSKTKETKMYKESLSNGKSRIFIDTMGTNDSEASLSNVEILRTVMDQLSKKSPNGINIKVIWIVKKDIRENSDYQIEAKFINSLGELSNNNIWDSTLILVRDSYLKALQSHKKGAIAAAIENGGNDEITCMGYNCFDRMSEEEKEPYLNFPNEQRIKIGFLYEKELKEKINEKLNEKSYILVKFKTQKCLNCGIIGDKRFITNKCHFEMELKHKTDRTFIHSSKIQFRHKREDTSLRHPSCMREHYHESLEIAKRHQNEKYFKHIGDVRTTHTESIGRKHIGTFVKTKHGTIHKYHPKHLQEVIIQKGDSTTMRWLAGVPTLGISEFFVRRQETEKVYACCNNRSGTEGCYSRCNACNQDISKEGCIGGYTCCDRGEGSEGCTEYYTCCGKGTTTKIGRDGCTEYMSCCDKFVSSSIGSRGCTELFKCCDKDLKSEGCKEYHVCCDAVKGSKGCKEKWSCGNDITSKGCESYHQCCGKKEGKQGCEGYFECCGDLSTNNNPCSFSCCKQKFNDSNTKGCLKFCRTCKKEWGTGGGCTENDKHEMVDL